MISSHLYHFRKRFSSSFCVFCSILILIFYYSQNSILKSALYGSISQRMSQMCAFTFTFAPEIKTQKVILLKIVSLFSTIILHADDFFTLIWTELIRNRKKMWTMMKRNGCEQSDEDTHCEESVKRWKTKKVKTKRLVWMIEEMGTGNMIEKHHITKWFISKCKEDRARYVW